MSYLVLARKYRPQRFTDIVGQSHVTLALRNAILKNRVPHALMFAGPRGVGKTTAARVLSKALNCTGREVPSLEEVKSGARTVDDVEPCGECSNCVHIAKGSNLAVQEIDGASNNSVDNVRQLIDSIHTLAPDGIEYKIYIIDEVHMLSTSAFNALLKSLEEPPPKTIFIFATTEPHKVPDTVLSRCQQHDFRRIAVAHIVEQLTYVAKEESFDVDPEVLHLIARICQGGMRDASSLLDRVCSFSRERIGLEQATEVLGVFDFGHFVDLIQCVSKADDAGALEIVRLAFTKSIDVRSYVNDFVRACRLLSLYVIASERGKDASTSFIEREELSDVESKLLSEIALELDASHTQRLFDVSIELAEQALQSSFPQYVLEAGVIKLCQLGNLLSLSELIQKVDAGSVAAVTEGVSAQSRPSPQSAGTAYKEAPKKKDSEPVATHSKPTSPLSLSDSSPASSSLSTETFVKKEEVTTVEESVTQENVALDKTLDWKSYLSYLKKTGELRLDTFLSRVLPEVFVVSSGTGSLSFLAQPFLAESCSDPVTIASIKKSLAAFTGVPHWNVEVGVHEGNPPSRQPESNVSTHLPGSAADQRHHRRLKRREQIEEEAVNDAFVKEALEVFEGSTVNKVIPAKRS